MGLILIKNVFKKISNVLKLSNLNNGTFQTSIRVTIKESSKREDIIITNTDKGGAIILIEMQDYIKEAEHQLNDNYNYYILPEDPTLGNIG